MIITNRTVGGTAVETIRRVDRWSPEQMDRIKLNCDSGMFADPLGFLQAFED